MTDPRAPQSPGEWFEALRAAGYYTTLRTATAVHEWVAESDTRPLVIEGGTYNGKSALADNVIRILEGDAEAHFSKTARLYYFHHDPFKKIFYEWDGFSRQQAVKVMSELGRPEEVVESYATSPKYMERGMLLRALRRERDIDNVLIDNFDGPYDDLVDEALAEFVSNRRMHIPEVGGYEGRAEGRRLRIIVILSGWKPRGQVARGRFYKALEEHGRRLTMDELDRPYQFYVLSQKFPKLPPQVVRELILFVERYNARPDVNYKTAFGEVVKIAHMLQDYHPGEGVSADLMCSLGGFFAKTEDSHGMLKSHAEDLMREVRQTAF